MTTTSIEERKIYIYIYIYIYNNTRKKDIDKKEKLIKTYKSVKRAREREKN